MNEVRLKAKGHRAYVKDGVLVIEWYDFGDDAPYESANMILFEGDGRAAMARSLGFAEDVADAPLLEAVEQRFFSFFQAREFAEQQGIAFRREVDFMP